MTSFAHRSSAVTVSALVALGLGLTGCGGSDSKSTTSASTSSSTSVATSTSSASAAASDSAAAGSSASASDSASTMGSMDPSSMGSSSGMASSTADASSSAGASSSAASGGVAKGSTFTFTLPATWKLDKANSSTDSTTWVNADDTQGVNVVYVPGTLTAQPAKLHTAVQAQLKKLNVTKLHSLPDTTLGGAKVIREAGQMNETGATGPMEMWCVSHGGKTYFITMLDSKAFSEAQLETTMKPVTSSWKWTA